MDKKFILDDHWNIYSHEIFFNIKEILVLHCIGDTSIKIMFSGNNMSLDFDGSDNRNEFFEYLVKTKTKYIEGIKKMQQEERDVHAAHLALAAKNTEKFLGLDTHG